MEPNPDSDVIVRHVNRGDRSSTTIGDRWVIVLRGEPRAETDSAQRAFIFARLLADLSQSRVWVVHDGGGPAEILDPQAVGGCSCC